MYNGNEILIGLITICKLKLNCFALTTNEQIECRYVPRATSSETIYNVPTTRVVQNHCDYIRALDIYSYTYIIYLFTTI